MAVRTGRRRRHRVVERVLVRHVWIRVPPGGDAVPPQLGRWWDALLDTGAPERVGGGPLRPGGGRADAAGDHPGDERHDGLGDGPAGAPFTIRALARLPGTGVSAVLHRSPDVAGATVVVDPDRARPWEEMRQQLPTLPQPRLGSATVLVAVAPHDPALPVPADVIALVERAAPGCTVGDALKVAPGVTAWELDRPTREPVGGPDRTFLALATAPCHQEALYRWCAGIDAGRWGPAPLAGRLVPAAQVRDLWARLRGDGAPPSTPDADPSHLLAQALSGRHPRWPADAARTVSDTWRYDVEAARLRSLRTEAEAALGNLRGPGGVLPPYDEALAERLVEQVRLLEHGNEAFVRSAEALRDVFDRAAREREQRLLLLQTSLIGALVMGLGAIQAFQLTVPPNPSVMWPVVGVLAAVALAAPPLTMRLADRGDLRLTIPDRAALATVGAATGWLVVAATAPGVAAPVVAAAGALVLGAVVPLLARWLGGLGRSVRSRSPRRAPRAPATRSTGRVPGRSQASP